MGIEIITNALTGEVTTREYEDLPVIVTAATFAAAIDAHVEAAARSCSYNSAAHLASYVSSTVPQWSAEATAFVAWRDQVWLAALALLGQVQGGAAMPENPQAFIDTLPALTRP